MVLNAYIDYQVIDELCDLKAVMADKPVAMDFEFLEGVEPYAYGLAYGKKAEGYRFGHYKPTEKTKNLKSIGYKHFFSQLQSLRSQGYRNFIIFGLNDYKCFYKLLQRKPALLQSEIRLINIQPVISGGKDGNISLFKAAALLGLPVEHYSKHNPQDDAKVLLQSAKQLALFSQKDYECYCQSVKQVHQGAAIENVNKMLASMLNSDLNTVDGQNSEHMNDVLRKLSEIRDSVHTIRKYVNNRKQTLANQVNSQDMSNAASSNVHVATNIFVDEIIFHYPIRRNSNKPLYITTRHNGKNKSYLLEDLNAKQLKKFFTSAKSLHTREQIKARYASQKKLDNKIIFLIHHSQYDTSTEAAFLEVLGEFLSPMDYQIVEI